jgi:hypothetical protein
VSSYVGFVVGNNKKTASKLIDATKTYGLDVHIKKVQYLPSGIACSVILKNTTQYTIKQNSLYVTYSIINGNSTKASECKSEARDNKLDIKPNEEVMLFSFIPVESYKDNKNIDISKLQYEVKGYFTEVTELNHFGQSGYLHEDGIEDNQ